MEITWTHLFYTKEYILCSSLCFHTFYTKMIKSFPLYCRDKLIDGRQVYNNVFIIINSLSYFLHKAYTTVFEPLPWQRKNRIDIIKYTESFFSGISIGCI